MIMPMSSWNESMFPLSTFSYKHKSNSCFRFFGVRPRLHWITTEYGGYVSVVFRVSVYIYISPRWKALLVYIFKLFIWCCVAQLRSCRKSIRCWRGLGATSSSPTECETHGVEAGRSICPSHYLIIHQHGFSLSDNICAGVHRNVSLFYCNQGAQEHLIQHRCPCHRERWAW